MSNSIYPFPFEEILLTDRMLEKLGFPNWWGGSGDFNDSRIELSGKSFGIHAVEEKDDESDGYGYPRYVAYHYTDENWNTLYFLHELYEYIRSAGDQYIEEFKNRCKECNLTPYIKSYEDFLLHKK